MPDDRADSPRLRDAMMFRRWGWVIAVTIILMVLLVFDTIPALRGYKDWPPEWRWLHDPGHFLWAIIPSAFIGVLLCEVGWRFDRSRGAARWIFALALFLSFGAWNISTLWIRSKDLGADIAPRTTTYFYEDFFQAAQAIDSPVEAFSRYDYLREHHNKLRIATHPPGAVFAYRALISLGAELPDSLGKKLQRFFMNDPTAAVYTPAEATGLALVSLLKLLFGAAGLGGVMLIERALRDDEAESFAGRFAALTALIPGLTIFTLTLDQMIAGLAALTLGLILLSLRPGKRQIPLAVAAGVALFVVSTLAYQVVTVALLAGVASILIAWRRSESIGAAVRMLLIPAGVAAMTLLALWLCLYATTSFNMFTHLPEGIAAHNKGPIHENRSRIAWLLWNPWDILFFFGIPWLGLWTRRVTWRPIIDNPILCALLVMWAAVILGDGIRGETARIMMFSYPLLACALLDRNRTHLQGGVYTILAALLMVQSVIFCAVLRVFYP